MTSEHGYTRYAKGCRCDICRSAKAEYQRQKRAERKAQRRQQGLLHGSVSAYVEWGCRCGLCVQRNRIRAAVQVTRLRYKPIPDRVHGTPTGRYTYLCACDLCRKAASDSRQRRRATS